MPQEERITFDHMPSILSFLVKEVRELKALIMKGQEEEPEDVWMDIPLPQGWTQTSLPSF